jgi:hypothetical protein
MTGLRRVTATLLLLGSCSADPDARSASVPEVAPTPDATAPPACPTDPIPSAGAPGTDDRHRDAKTWMQSAPAGAQSAVLVDPALIPALNDRFAEHPGAWRDPSHRDVGLPEAVSADIEERLRYLEDMVARGSFVEGEPGSLGIARSIAARSTAVDHQRLVLTEAQLHCVPLDTGLYKPPIDPAFDRNACSSLHPGERIRVLRRDPSGRWLHVHAGHTVGWLHDAALTPRLSRDDLDAWESATPLVPLRDDVTTTDGFPLRLGVTAPLLGKDDTGWRVRVPATDGLREATVPADASVAAGHPPLQRDLLLQVAFSELGQPYGWGGRAGERDCSQYLRDVFATFGIQLARHSSVQAELGTHNIDVAGKSEAEKRELIATWHERGVVLLYMTGHIMLYVGREGGQDFALSSVSEYLEPCTGGPDTVHKLDRVEVTTLELGRGSERTAFIERISRLVVFAPNT